MKKLKKMIVCLDLAGCPNRCKHCWIGISPNGKLNINDLCFVADKFRPFTNNLEITSWYREPDFLENYKELWEIENKLSDSRTVKHFELISFWRAVRDKNYIPWIKDLGVQKCQLTLWGGKEKTDYYTGRNGAFDEIIETINILINNRIAPRIQIFANRDNVDNLIEIENIINDMKLEEKCLSIGIPFSAFVHQGSSDGENMKLYDIYITPNEINKISGSLVKYSLKHFNKNNIMDIFGLTEQTIYDELVKDNSTVNYTTEEPIFYVDKDFDVYPNISNCTAYWCLGNLKKDAIEMIVNNYIENKSIAQNISINVSLCDIVKEIGNRKSQRLFGKNDYKIYILNKYCEKVERGKNCT
jgi:MoaA/NifB/PqqE/SkfB family radical SAM enzyme